LYSSLALRSNSASADSNEGDHSLGYINRRSALLPSRCSDSKIMSELHRYVESVTYWIYAYLHQSTFNGIVLPNERLESMPSSVRPKIDVFIIERVRSTYGRRHKYVSRPAMSKMFITRMERFRSLDRGLGIPQGPVVISSLLSSLNDCIGPYSNRVVRNAERDQRYIPQAEEPSSAQVNECRMSRVDDLIRHR
jgi:hypothetical protein